MTAVASKNIRNRVGDLTLQVFGTGPYGTLIPTASGGVVSIPSGYRIVFAVGNGEARIAQIQQGVDVSASNNDVIYAVVTGQEITAIEAAANAPAGSQILGTATGTPVDTFTQDALTGGKADLVFDPDAIHDNVAAEVSAVAEKVAPVAADLILIEDSAAANAKKRAQVGNLPVGGALDLLYVRDEKATTVPGGGFTSGADRTRDLNTVVVNQITGASLASNQITLPNGTYRIRARAPANQVNRHRAKLWNVTDGSNEVLGGSGHFPSNTVSSDANVWGRFTVSGGPKVFELRHRCDLTRATNGFGVDSFFGDTEVYAEVWIEKE